MLSKEKIPTDEKIRKFFEELLNLLKLEGKNDDIVNGGLKNVINQFAKEQLQKDLPTLSSDEEEQQETIPPLSEKDEPSKE